MTASNLSPVSHRVASSQSRRRYRLQDRLPGSVGKTPARIHVVNFIGHVHAPTIDAEFEPVSGNTPKKFSDSGGLGIEFGQFSNVVKFEKTLPQ
jgi:hypothetical protein